MNCQVYLLSYVDDISVDADVFRKFFSIYFHEQMLFQSFVAKRDTGQFFWEIIGHEQHKFD